MDEDLERLLPLLGDYLCNRPRAITAQDMATLTADGLPAEEAWRLLLVALVGLDTVDDPADRALYRRCFSKMCHVLDAEAVRQDPYLATIRFPEASDGVWRFTQERYAPWEAFVCDDFRTLADGRTLPQIGCFAEAFAYPAVLENGRLWMSVTPNEMATIRPVAEAAFGETVALGLGLGYFAFMALQNPNVRRVTVVERSSEALRLFERYLLPQFPRRECLRLVQADAFTWMQEAYPKMQPDFLFADLWHDVSDGLSMARKLRPLAAPSPRTVYHAWIEKTMAVYDETFSK